MGYAHVLVISQDKIGHSLVSKQLTHRESPITAPGSLIATARAFPAQTACTRDLPAPPRPQMHQTSPRGRPGHPAKAPVAAARASIAAGVADDNLLARNSEDPRCPGVLSRHLLYHGTQTRSDTRRRSSASLLHACALDARRAAALRCAAACFTMCPNWHLKLNH